MNTSILKMTWRCIKNFFGRYIALLLIVALSAGFFAGLKITTGAMIHTGDVYLAEQHFYDFRMMSTLGFTKEDVEAFAEQDYIAYAEGTITVDAMVYFDDNNRAYKVLAMPEKMNLPTVLEGRMPEAANECVVDDEYFTKADIGKKIKISKENSESVTSQIEGDTFTIVGLVNSPLYLNIDRGTTGIGSGAIRAYIYLPKEVFTSEVYTEINVGLTENAEIYSGKYEELIEKYEKPVTDLCNEQAEKRYHALLEAQGLTPEQGTQAGIVKPKTYILTREENAGYVGFENDTKIIGGIANIFPVFFILIAMLVCTTTMTRMVDEERTQIGVLKALGYSDGAIMAKYLLYAGSATFIGWLVGFFFCTWGLPQVFWFAYNALYNFSPLVYLFSPELAVVTLAVSLLSILGSTFISCKKELESAPAKLIRPRTAKNGKRIFMERLTLVWNKLSFLQKITLRNMFRYKRRLVMMLVGISCCGALVVAAFGVRDSMIHIADLQYEEIQKYQLEAAFDAKQKATVCEKLDALEGVEKYHLASVHLVDVSGEETMNSVTMMSFDDTSRLGEFWDFHSGKDTVAYPQKGEVIINKKVAEKLELEIGDTMEIRDADMQSCHVTVSGIFDNYLFHFVVISPDTYSETFGSWEANTALIVVKEAMTDEKGIDKIAGTLTDMSEIKSVSKLSSLKDNVASALSCLDYIIWLIVLFSGALAFIVIFNLTNINLAERSREIATVLVLGFYPKETESYVLRENLVLSVLASFIGLPLGTLFHRVIMDMILIDALAFDIHIKQESYVLAFICTVLFAVIVNVFMRRQINKIHMTESLKAVE